MVFAAAGCDGDQDGSPCPELVTYDTRATSGSVHIERSDGAVADDWSRCKATLRIDFDDRSSLAAGQPAPLKMVMAALCTFANSQDTVDFEVPLAVDPRDLDGTERMVQAVPTFSFYGPGGECVRTTTKTSDAPMQLILTADRASGAATSYPDLVTPDYATAVRVQFSAGPLHGEPRSTNAPPCQTSLSSVSGEATFTLAAATFAVDTEHLCY